MKQMLVSIIVVLLLLVLAVTILGRVDVYENYQVTYRSGPLVHWVNNKILVDDGGKTPVPFAHHLCTVDELLRHDRKSLLKTCHAVGATVPINNCNFWWLAGDCIGLNASRDVLENRSLREAIIDAVRKGCTENDFQVIDLGYLCDEKGKLKHEILLKSVSNGDLKQLEYIIR